MKCRLLLLLFCTFLFPASGQVDCSCWSYFPGGNTVYLPVVYRFNRADAIAICGTPRINSGDTTYSEFSVYKCGVDAPLDEWDGTATCRVKRVGDILIISELYGIPNGPDFKVVWSPFFYIHYSFNRHKLVRQLGFYHNNRKYTKAEINQVLANYAAINKAALNNYDPLMQSGWQLFWAAVSGSKEAVDRLAHLEERFGPFDGGVSEEWKEIVALYELWKSVSAK